MHVNFICHGCSQLDGPSTIQCDHLGLQKNKRHSTGTNKAIEKQNKRKEKRTFCFHITLTFEICILNVHELPE